MDARSHMLFGKTILEKCCLDSDYALWATSPDTDFYFLHRYKRHRFSVIPNIYTEFVKLNPGIPHTDRLSIAIGIASHFYLDLFNAPIFCWGLRCPAVCVPPHLAKEYIDDFNFDLFDDKPNEAIETFYAKSQSLFDSLPTMTTDECFTFLLGDLARHTPVLPIPHRAIQSLQSFTNSTIHYFPKSYTLTFTSKYYSFLNSFFETY